MQAAPRAKRKHYYRYVMLVYVICISIAILVWNRISGNMIGGWYQTSEVNGMGADEFKIFVSLFGYSILLFAPITAGLFIWQSLEEKSRNAKIVCLLRAAVCIFFLVYLSVIGVFEFIAWM